MQKDDEISCSHSCESPRHCLRLLFIVKHGIRFEHPKARHEIISHTLYETVPWVNFSDIFRKIVLKSQNSMFTTLLL